MAFKDWLIESRQWLIAFGIMCVILSIFAIVECVGEIRQSRNIAQVQPLPEVIYYDDELKYPYTASTRIPPTRVPRPTPTPTLDMANTLERLIATEYSTGDISCRTKTIKTKQIADCIVQTEEQIVFLMAQYNMDVQRREDIVAERMLGMIWIPYAGIIDINNEDTLIGYMMVCPERANCITRHDILMTGFLAAAAFAKVEWETELELDVGRMPFGP